MSFNIYVKKNKSSSFQELLNNKYMPEDTKVSFGINKDEILNGYAKVYTPKLSSRGVAITTNANNYVVEVNVAASKQDWHLAVKVALGLGHLNDSPIHPDFDDDLSIAEFEAKYNDDWIESVKHQGIDTFIQMINEGTDVILTFMGCVRHFYVGQFIVNKLSLDNPSVDIFNDRLIEEIRKIQCIEDDEDAIEFPSVRIMDFPGEGEKKITIFPPNFKVLLPAADYVILNKIGEALVKVPYSIFIDHIASKSIRVDELQYVINAVDDRQHYDMLLYFKEIESLNQNQNQQNSPLQKEPETRVDKNEVKKWWKLW